MDINFFVTLTARLPAGIENTFYNNTTFMLSFPQNRNVEKQAFVEIDICDSNKYGLKM